MRTIFRNVAVRIDYGSCINRIHSEVGEDALRYREIPRLLDNVTMYGYFQSPTYFDHCREEIQNLFAPEEWRVKYLAVKYESAQNAYFIHVRRGDYLTHEMHNVDLRGYYKRALDMVGRDKLYYVFSDDLNWCQNWEELRGMNVRYINEPDELNSLYLMSMCGLGGICANSSYSWWGAYLNRNSDKKIILPQKWFNNDWVIENACSDWTVLE
jgi:hypothetical protein